MSVDCDPKALLDASIPYRQITGSNVGAVVIYLLAKKSGLDGLSPKELMDLAKCYDCNIPPGMMKSVEVALLCAATGGVTPCPPCPPSGGGGGCTYQDMQVAWTPSNLKLGQNIGLFVFQDFDDPITNLTLDYPRTCTGVDIEFNSQIVTASFPNLTTIQSASTNAYFIFDTDTALTSVSAPLLATATGVSIKIQSNPVLTSVDFSSLGTVDNQVRISSNPSLTSILLGSVVNGISYTFPGNALSASCVNALLAVGVANAGFVSGQINLGGGTSASPTGQGIVDKATLNARQAGLAITN